MADSCIISKDQLSSKEQQLKSRLYGGSATSTSPTKRSKSKPQVSQKSMGYQTQAKRASPVKIVEHHKTQLQEVTDQKMDNFIDEMRQQFFTTQNANVIPQGLLYQQTRSMEKQVSLLEQNQKTMGDIINNLMNSEGTGPNTAASLKQQIFNDSRRMLLDMMIPFNQQLNDMKLMYENNKNISRELGSKLDELKQTFTMQSQNMGMTGASQASMMNPFQQHLMMPGMSGSGVMDPQIMKKGLEDIKDQMREVQKEAMTIENEMEKRRNQMIQKEQTSKYLPQTITEEFSQFKQQLKTGEVQSHIDKVHTIGMTRQAVYHKLGGQFDYGQFLEELRQIGSEREIIDREFKTQQLFPPDFKGEKVFGKVTYDFSTKPMHDMQKDLQSQEKKQNVEHRKPFHYQEIITQPKYIIDKNIRIPDPEPEQYQQQQFERKPERSIQENKPLGTFLSVDQKSYGSQSMGHQQQNQYSQAQQPINQYSQAQQQQPTKAGQTRQTVNQKPVHDYVQKRVDFDQSIEYSQSFAPSESQPRQQMTYNDQRMSSAQKKQQIDKDISKLDILTLKKQVIEEIKNELQLNKGMEYAPKDPYRDEAQKYKDQKDFNSVKMKGGKDKQSEEEDLQSQIMTEIQKSKVQFELDKERSVPVRQSNQSSLSNQQLSESMILNTVADVILKEINKDSASVLTQSQENPLSGANEIEQKDIQKYGEQVLIDKIQEIFNEVAKEQIIPTEESMYQSQRRNQGFNRFDQHNTSVQVLEQSLDQNKRDSYRQSGRFEQQVPSQQQQYQQQQQTQNTQSYQHPMVVPVIVNNGGQTSQSQDFFKNPNQLRDMISQSISAQLQLHNLKKGDENDPLNQTTRTMEEEEAKTKMEQQLLRKQIPINVHPYISQTINQGAARTYQNPFIVGPNSNSANMFGIQPPLLNDLDQFNLDTESSDFMSMDSSQYSNFYGKNQGRSKSKGHKRYSNITLSERSDGEVGKESDNDQSLGEIQVPGPQSSNIKRGSPSRQQQAQFRQTYNYEEEKIPEDIIEKPIYESTEGPIPKGAKAKRGQGAKRKQPTGKSGQNILNSADSFGINPLRSAKGGVNESKNFQSRQKIDDNFLEEEDDYQSSKMSESGEIDPKLLARH